MKLAKILGRKNGHSPTQDKTKKQVEQRLNQVERKITNAHASERAR